MADLPEWIKKLEHYECDGQMELEDYLQENRKESGNDEEEYIRADYGRGAGNIPEDGDRTYTD